MTSSNDDSLVRIGSQYAKYVVIIIRGADCQADVSKGLSDSVEACIAAAILCGHSPPHPAYCADRQFRLRKKSMQGYASRLSAF